MIKQLNVTFEYVIFFVFLSASLMLFFQIKRLKSNHEDIKSRIYMYYGFSLLFGAIATGIWAIYRSLRSEFPQVQWSNLLKFYELPIKDFSPNLLILMTIISLGGCVFFLSRTVEMDIQQKSKPYFSNFLLLMEILVAIGTFLLKTVGNSTALDIIFSAIFYIWVISFVIAAVNIGLTYLKLTLNSTGIIKKKSLVILLGFAFTLIFIGLRDFFKPQFIANLLGSLSVLVLYKGITLDSEN